MNRLIVWFVAAAVIILALFGVLVLLGPTIVQSAASHTIQQEIGVPVRVEARTSPWFIFDGHIRSLRVYSPSFQLNGLTMRQLDVTIDDVRVKPASLLRGKPEVTSFGRGAGRVTLASGDINDFLEASNMNASVEIRDHDLFLTTYISGIGKLVLKGRLYPHGATIVFEPMDIVQPRLVSLLMAPGIWKSAGFSFDLAPLDEIFYIDRVFVSTSTVEVSFTLKKDALDALDSSGEQ
jgi:hypothetical protein